MGTVAILRLLPVAPFRPSTPSRALRMSGVVSFAPPSAWRRELWSRRRCHRVRAAVARPGFGTVALLAAAMAAKPRRWPSGTGMEKSDLTGMGSVTAQEAGSPGEHRGMPSQRRFPLPSMMVRVVCKERGDQHGATRRTSRWIQNGRSNCRDIACGPCQAKRVGDALRSLVIPYLRRAPVVDENDQNLLSGFVLGWIPWRD